MATFRSNLNSVSNTYGLGGLQTLQKRITTCFQNWRSKTIAQQQKQQQFFTQQQHDGQHYFEFTFREYSLVAKTSDRFRNFNTKLRKFLHAPKKKSKNHKRSEESLEIVTKLLSSTLIASAVATTTTTTSTQANCKGVEEANMTITDDTLLQVRFEHPELDTEVRSILLARAQDGATISEIKEDYRKGTGSEFPIYNNITEYLLTIPSVSALCNEHGTRIFNIVPTEKTKHLYEMVMQQKTAQRYQAAPAYRSGQRRLPSYITQNRRQMWRNNDHQQSNYQQRVINNKNHYNNNKDVYNVIAEPETEPLAPAPNSVELMDIDGENFHSHSNDVVMENYYYQDNCNHFYRRFYDPENVPPPYEVHRFEHNNNNNNNNLPLNAQIIDNVGDNMIDNNNYDFNNLNAPYNDDLVSQKFPQQQQHNAFKNTNINNINSGNFKRKRNMRSSSPAYMKSSHHNESHIYSFNTDFEAHLLDFPLLGDDFFLYMARMELKCKFKKHEKVLQSGLCVSGQTINGALRRVRRLPDCNRRIIVNIGSVDIMQGRSLVKIQHDFRELVNVMHKNGLTPILTTLAPLANYAHDKEMTEKLQRFNQFIKQLGQHLVVIDIWSCLMNKRKHTLFDCFQNEPRSVTGAPEPYVFWNKIGRQRVLQLIESQIEY